MKSKPKEKMDYNVVVTLSVGLVAIRNWTAFVSVMIVRRARPNQKAPYPDDVLWVIFVRIIVVLKQLRQTSHPNGDEWGRKVCKLRAALAEQATERMRDKEALARN